MLGILRKDLYDTFLIPKNILSNGFGYLFMFLFAYLLGPNYYMMMVFIMLAIPATSVMVLQAAIEQDESVRFDDVLLTYPISKKQIILTRFCGNLIGILLNMALSFLLMLGYVYGGKTTDIQNGIFIWLAGCVISLYAVAVFSVGFYLLGKRNDRVCCFYFNLGISICNPTFCSAVGEDTGIWAVESAWNCFCSRDPFAGA